jgi:exportin-2 (importin alpha re-exporter)
MEINDQSLSFLHEMLLKILSSDNNIRKSSETYLKSIELHEGYSILVLTLIKHLVNSINPQDIAIRQSASILFKNLIKNHWNNDYDNDDNNTILINDKDKELIKVHVIELMCVVSNDVQNQLAESITIISKYDFPKKWMNLLPQLIEKLNVNDINITKGVMLTANSIMKRFRYVFRSDELYSEILICLQYFQIPLLQQFQYYTNTLLIQYSNNKTELIITVETIRLISRIFFSLNWQDIPEFFEDNVSVWMTEFTKYLTYTNILLIDDNEDNESGPIEKLQSAIIDNINLYANKYEEIFEPFLSQFTQLIWKLLIEISIKTKYDILAVSSIKFLISVSSKEMNSNLFTINILKDIVEQIIVKNITVTDNDEELFDDNPIDYISKDMEGNDQDTRRRCAIELIRSLLKFHLIPMTELSLTYINAMLTHYHTTNDWKAKDAALNLILAVSVKSSNNISGAGTLNTNINILSIFEIHVLPEIQQQQNSNNYINHHPIVKADAIKLVCLFRSHLPKQLLLSIIPYLIQFMYSKYIVIQTYAAMTIERFLCIKDKISIDNSNSSGFNGINNSSSNSSSTKTINRITKDDVLPYIESLFNGLFSILDNINQPDNEYVMMCVMRCLLILSNDNNNNIITSITELILLKLTNYLDRICKNPINPYYNHYLFESIALLIRSCCNTTTTTNNNNQEVILIAASRFELLLFPLFQSILAQDVTEFIPYVFQILAQLLCIRPINSGYSEAYKSLFPPLLSPSLWERKGNVPALTDLFIAYISRGMKEIIENNYITGVLGVFQKLLSSKVSFMMVMMMMMMMMMMMKVMMMMMMMMMMMNIYL